MEGLLRLKKETKRVLNKFARARTPVIALRFLAELAGRPMYERKTTVSYNAKTGKAKNTRWFDNDYHLGLVWGNETHEIAKMYQAVLKTIPAGQLMLIKTNLNFVVIEHVGSHSEADGTTPAHLQIRLAQQI